MRKIIFVLCILAVPFSAQCQVGKYSITESFIPTISSAISSAITDSSSSDDELLAIVLLALAKVDMNDLTPHTFAITNEAFVFFNEKGEEIDDYPVELLSAQKDKWIYKGEEEDGEIVVQKNNDCEYTITAGDKIKLKLKPIK